jgi:class 3 adenylate cyclase
MILLLLTVTLVSVVLIAGVGYTSAREILTRSVENQLQGVRVAKTTAMKTMLEALRDQVVSMSDSRAAIEGMRDMRQAFRELGTKTLTAAQEQELRSFYEAQYLSPLAKYLSGKPVPEQYIPTSATERYLQYHYIAANPHPYLSKQDVEGAPVDPSSYGAAHERWHKIFARAASIFGFADLMLVDAESLEVVYSYQKTVDFATNLETGPYADTNLADRVRMLRSSRDKDDFKIADFEPYRPNLGIPMGFALSPIFDGPQMIGILVVQFPIEDFNTVLSGNYKWEQEGMGKTGESFLVGQDRKMRSRSRLMYEDPEQFFRDLAYSGASASVIDQVRREKTVMDNLTLDSLSVQEALRGHSGLARVQNYLGKEVLSAYGPIEMDTVRWAVITEIGEDEANAPIRAFGRKVVEISTALILAVSLLALVASHLLTRPLRRLTEGALRLGAGETGVRVSVSSKDEFGELATVFNSMAENIKAQTDLLEEQIRENQELLLNILPASAVAQRQEGDSHAQQEFADVTVLFAEICGMEAFGSKGGDSGALSALSDLVTAFDEAADKFGIEKVKTIGGSYLAVCGLSVSRPDHARRVIMFAEEMQRIVAIFNREHHAELSLAVGINSGPVVGGIIGRRKFLYDLWGETVAIARKLAIDKAAAIRVTGPVRERMGEQFQFNGPERIDLPGHPELETWKVAV